MTIDDVTKTLESIKKAGTDPLEHIDSEIAKLVDQAERLKRLRAIFAPIDQPAKRTWSRKKKDKEPETTAINTAVPLRGGEDPTPIRIAKALLKQPMTTREVIALGIASDPTIRNYLKPPHFSQSVEGKWSVTTSGKHQCQRPCR